MRLIEEKIDVKEKKDNIIDGIMKSKGLYCLVSFAKVGKSMLLIQFSNSLTSGTQFLGHNTMSSSVIYITTESDFGQIQERIKTLGLKFPKTKFWIIDRDNKGEVNIKKIKEELNKFNKEYKKILIIDMLKDINFEINYDINSYQDIGQKLLPTLRGLCEEYNLTIIFTHHLNKRGEILGSTAFDAVVDGKLTLIPSKNDKSLVRLNIINRDFPEQDIYLKKTDNQIFNVINIEDEDELDNDFINFVKYVADKKETEFTCSDIVTKAKLNRTPKQFGKFLKANDRLLKNEGVTITDCRSGNQRLYKAFYEEVIEEE